MFSTFLLHFSLSDFTFPRLLLTFQVPTFAFPRSQFKLSQLDRPTFSQRVLLKNKSREWWHGGNSACPEPAMCQRPPPRTAEVGTNKAPAQVVAEPPRPLREERMETNRRPQSRVVPAGGPSDPNCSSSRPADPPWGLAEDSPSTPAGPNLGLERSDPLRTTPPPRCCPRGPTKAQIFCCRSPPVGSKRSRVKECDTPLGCLHSSSSPRN